MGHEPNGLFACPTAENSRKAPGPRLLRTAGDHASICALLSGFDPPTVGLRWRVKDDTVCWSMAALVGILTLTLGRAESE